MGYDNYIIGKFIEFKMISFASRHHMMMQKAETYFVQELLENWWQSRGWNPKPLFSENCRPYFTHVLEHSAIN